MKKYGMQYKMFEYILETFERRITDSKGNISVEKLRNNGKKLIIWGILGLIFSMGLIILGAGLMVLLSWNRGAPILGAIIFLLIALIGMLIATIGGTFFQVGFIFKLGAKCMYDSDKIDFVSRENCNTLKVCPVCSAENKGYGIYCKMCGCKLDDNKHLINMRD